MASLFSVFGEFNDFHKQTDKCTRFLLNLRNLKDFFKSLYEFIVECFDDFHRWLYKEAFTQGGIDNDDLRATHERMLMTISQRNTSEIYRSMDLMKQVVEDYRFLTKKLSTFSPSGKTAQQFHLSVSKQLRDWKEVYDTCIYNIEISAKQLARPEPLCVYLYGKAGKGKTFTAPIIANCVSQMLRKEPLSEHERYSRNPIEEFWSGYHGQYCCSYEEWLQETESTDRQRQCCELIKMISTDAYMLPMAIAQEKGKSYFDSSLVVITGNESARPKVPITCALALYRRMFAIQIIENKKNTPVEYSVADLDNCYKFLVSYYNWENQVDYIKRTCSFSQLLSLLNEKHIYNQKASTLAKKLIGPVVASNDIGVLSQNTSNVETVTEFDDEVEVIRPDKPLFDESFVNGSKKIQQEVKPVWKIKPKKSPTKEDCVAPAQGYQKAMSFFTKDIEWNAKLYYKSWFQNWNAALRRFIHEHYNIDFWNITEDVAKVLNRLLLNSPQDEVQRTVFWMDLLSSREASTSYYLGGYLNLNIQSSIDLGRCIPQALLQIFFSLTDERIKKMYPTEEKDLDMCIEAQKVDDYFVLQGDVPMVLEHLRSKVVSKHKVEMDGSTTTNLHHYLPLSYEKGELDELQEKEYLTVIFNNNPLPTFNAWHLKFQAFKTLDKKQEFRISNFMMCATLIAIGFMVALLVAFFLAIGHKPPEMLEANSSHPMLKRMEKIWMKKRVPVVIPAQGGDQCFTSLAYNVLANTRLLKVNFGNNSMYCFATFIYGTVCLAASHCIPSNVTSIEVSVNMAAGQVETRKFLPSEIQIERLAEDDLCWLAFPGSRMPSFRDLRAHLLDANLESYDGATRVSFTDDGEHVMFMASSSASIIAGKSYYQEVDGVITYITPTQLVECVGCEGIDGDCGQVYLMKHSPSPQKIAGFHVAGLKDKSYFVPITKANLPKKLVTFDPVTTFEHPKAQSSFEPHSKCSIIESQESAGIHMAVECHISKPHFQNCKTDLKPSIMQTGIEVNLNGVAKQIATPWPIKQRPAILTRDQASFAKQYKKLAGKKNEKLPDLVNDPEVWQGLFPKDPRIRKLTVKEVIDGIPGFIPSLDNDTCSGWPYCEIGTPRKQLFRRSCDDGGYWVRPDVLADIQDFELKAMEGIAKTPVFVGFQKDELRPLLEQQGIDPSKWLPKDPRPIQAAPLWFLIICKMYFGAWTAVVSQQRGPVAIGLNPYSTQWYAEYREFYDFAKGKVDSQDVSGFDLNYPGDFYIPVVRNYVAAYFGDKLPLGIKRIYYMVGHCHFNYRLLVGAIVYIATHMCTGGFMTAHWNTILTLVMHRVVALYLMLQKGFRLPLAENMKLLGLGDDNYRTVRDTQCNGHELLEVLSPINVSNTIKLLFGHTCTSSSKGKIGAWQSMDDADFLKRFLRRQDGVVVCPLRLEDMQQHLLWYNSRSDLCEKEQFTQNCHNTLREAYFHGRSTFNEMKATINPFLLYLGENNVFFPTYDDLHAMYIQSLQKC